MTRDALLEGRAEGERFRLLVEAVTDYAIYMLDPNGIVTSWNAGAERIKGYRASEILGRSFSEFYEEADRKTGIPQRVLEIAGRDGKFQAEGWRVRKDGSRFWAFVIIDAIYDNGQLIGFAKITRDLTERREAEEELRRSEELFRRLVEGVTDYAIYMLDPSGIVSNWNAGAQRIKGYGPDEIVGQHFSIF
ncbi:MAG TPA: PAS domain S-box protein, partial [Reyranella sp.]|nr:PAS domain S-box protein [Reyranella sp.]